jgi:FkbM family methyltransferase
MKQFIDNNKMIQRLFNSGKEYSIFNEQKVIYGAQDIDYFVTTEAAKYKVDGYSNYMVKETRTEYDWSDMRPDDVVLDLGSNIGGFAIGAARRVKYVFAVEPIFFDKIEAHVKLNKYDNVTVLPYAIGGSGGTVDITYGDIVRKKVPVYSLQNIRDMLQQKITFLKCDIEGFEWYLNPSEFDGIRRIEMEVHPVDYPTEKINPDLIPYLKEHWDVTCTEEDRLSYILHAKEKI